MIDRSKSLPRAMLVWDDATDKSICDVVFIHEDGWCAALHHDGNSVVSWDHCAELPTKRPMTQREAVLFLATSRTPIVIGHKTWEESSIALPGYSDMWTPDEWRYAYVENGEVGEWHEFKADDDRPARLLADD